MATKNDSSFFTKLDYHINLMLLITLFGENTLKFIVKFKNISLIFITSNEYRKQLSSDGLKLREFFGMIDS